MMEHLKWSVDSLVVKEDAIFGFGWVFHQDVHILSVGFRFGGDVLRVDRAAYLRADFGKSREDVAQAFPGHRTALNSGFVIFGQVPTGGRAQSVSLEVGLNDGRSLILPIPPAKIAWLGKEGDKDGGQRMLAQFVVFFKRGLHLARARQFSSLFEKVRRYLQGRPKTALRQPADLSRALKEEGNNDIVLIVDHDLGGGANQYRDRLVESLLKADKTVLIFTFHVATLSHMLIVRSQRVSMRLGLPGKDFLVDALRQLPVKEIIYNTGVSFVRPEELPPLLLRLKKDKHARLKVLVHDYFALCPSHFLLNHEGVFCRLPERDVCAGCLPRNQQGFAGLFAKRDIGVWRAAWGGLLQQADEIVTFSKSSAQMVRQAYPQIPLDSISVMPHVVHHLDGKIPSIKSVDRLHIGIVGQIGLHKGSGVVQALAREIKFRGADIRISVIGALEAPCEPGIVTQTGPYSHGSLAKLIEDSGANVMLFPSIWPETFSYVVQELMEMQLAVATFDFGAAAERVAVYAKGLILQSEDIASILNELISFHRTIYVKS
jgi:glycosyltransferase involved in cell wall biosynthesis